MCLKPKVDVAYSQKLQMTGIWYIFDKYLKILFYFGCFSNLWKKKRDTLQGVCLNCIRTLTFFLYAMLHFRHF